VAIYILEVEGAEQTDDYVTQLRSLGGRHARRRKARTSAQQGDEIQTLLINPANGRLGPSIPTPRTARQDPPVDRTRRGEERTRNLEYTTKGVPCDDVVTDLELGMVDKTFSTDQLNR
jgi:hypothetical protein